jgi:hypothetical protein
MATKTDLVELLAEQKDSAIPEGVTLSEIETYATYHNAILKAEKITKPLNEKIKAAYVETGTYLAGNVVVERTEAKTFDPAEFAITYPREQFPQYYVEVPATLQLNPVVIEAALKNQFQKVTQKLAVHVIGG